MGPTVNRQQRNGLVAACYFNPETGRFTQEDPIGLAGRLNVYGYANADPITFSDPFGLKADTLSREEQEAYSDMCAKIDCGKVQVYRGQDDVVTNAFRRRQLTLSGGRSHTLGYHIYLADGDGPDVLAHELAHVVQYVEWGPLTYYARGAAERVREATGDNPYTLPRPLSSSLKGWSDHGMEQQGQIVQNCFGGNTEACILSPYQPKR